MKISEYITWQKKNGKTIREICEELEICRTTYYEYTKGKSGKPVRPRKRMAKALVILTDGIVTMKDLGW